MKKSFHAAALPAVLAAAAIIIDVALIPSAPVLAGESSGWEKVSDGTDSSGAVTEEDGSDGKDGVPQSEEAYLAADPGEDAGIRREKYYLLEAMNQLENRGFSPISVWAKVTGNERILDRVRSAGQSAVDAVTDAVSEKVSETGQAVSEKVQAAGDAAAEQAKDAVQEQTEKAKKNLFETIRDWIRDIVGSGKKAEHE